MSGLKFLIKQGLYVICLCLFSSMCQAQILNMSLHFDKLNIEEEFFHSLALCRFYTISEHKEHSNMEVDTTYTVVGLKDNLCRMMVEGKTNTSVKIVQTCALPLDVAKEYAEALRKFQDKQYSPLHDKEILQQDKDYQKALAIMENRQFCQILRDEIDNTGNIRKNLPECRAAEQIEAFTNFEVVRKILGNTAQGCNYRYSIRKKADDKGIVAYSFDFDCNWKKEQQDKYLRILQANVIPAEEGSDFSAVMRISPKEEIEFIFDNCDFKANK